MQQVLAGVRWRETAGFKVTLGVPAFVAEMVLVISPAVVSLLWPSFTATLITWMALASKTRDTWSFCLVVCDSSLQSLTVNGKLSSVPTRRRNKTVPATSKLDFFRLSRNVGQLRRY